LLKRCQSPFFFWKLSIPTAAVRRVCEDRIHLTDQGEIEMKFLSVYKTPERGAPPSQAEMDSMGKLIEEGMKAGYLLAVEGCLPTAAGARVRLSNGKVTVTDGPFTEAKEVIGGLAILQAKSKQEAIDFVSQFLHTAGDGECELRQLFEAEPR
jgi:hypothetical protein